MSDLPDDTIQGGAPGVTDPWADYIRGPYSYLVTVEDNYYYARNYKGEIEFEGSKGPTVANLALANGRKVILGDGEFKLYSGDKIIVKSGNTLVASGRSSPFWGTPVYPTVLRRYSGESQPIIEVEDGAVGFHISDLATVSGFLTGSMGLLLHGGHVGTVERVGLLNQKQADGKALRIETTSLDSLTDVTFRDIHVNSCLKAIEFEGYSIDQPVTNIRFENIYGVNVKSVGMDFVKYADSIETRYAFLAILVGGNGVILNSGDPTNDVGVNSDMFYSLICAMASSGDYPIIVNKNSWYHSFITRQSTGKHPYVKVQNGGLAQWIANLCKPIRKSGTSTGTGGQQAIPHGLCETPNRVLLSDEDAYAYPYQSLPPDGTNIYINAAAGLKYQYEAFYVPE